MKLSSFYLLCHLFVRRQAFFLQLLSHAYIENENIFIDILSVFSGKDNQANHSEKCRFKRFHEHL